MLNPILKKENLKNPNIYLVSFWGLRDPLTFYKKFFGGEAVKLGKLKKREIISFKKKFYEIVG
jgi:hypothetical protein